QAGFQFIVTRAQQSFLHLIFPITVCQHYQGFTRAHPSLSNILPGRTNWTSFVNFVLTPACFFPSQGDFTWSSLSGQSVRLTPVAIQSLSELERARLQEVAYTRLLQDYDLGGQITIPKGESTILIFFLKAAGISYTMLHKFLVCWFCIIKFQKTSAFQN
ncbi:hypothetical protein GOODEAATRI_002759, partial [Goodea atripinnis]